MYIRKIKIPHTGKVGSRGAGSILEAPGSFEAIIGPDPTPGKVESASLGVGIWQWFAL